MHRRARRAMVRAGLRRARSEARRYRGSGRVRRLDETLSELLSVLALAHLYRLHGKTAEAIASLREGVKCTLEADEEKYRPESVCYESALFSYRNGSHDLTLTICDNWERYVQAQGYGEKSYHAIRAALLLATGRQQEADQEVARAVQENRKSRRGRTTYRPWSEPSRHATGISSMRRASACRTIPSSSTRSNRLNGSMTVTARRETMRYEGTNRLVAWSHQLDALGGLICGSASEV